MCAFLINKLCESSVRSRQLDTTVLTLMYFYFLSNGHYCCKATLPLRIHIIRYQSQTIFIILALR